MCSPSSTPRSIRLNWIWVYGGDTCYLWPEGHFITVILKLESLGRSSRHGSYLSSIGQAHTERTKRQRHNRARERERHRLWHQYIDRGMVLRSSWGWCSRRLLNDWWSEYHEDCLANGWVTLTKSVSHFCFEIIRQRKISVPTMTYINEI